jgi:hypothetical protein
MDLEEKGRKDVFFKRRGIFFPFSDFSGGGRPAANQRPHTRIFWELWTTNVICMGLRLITFYKILHRVGVLISTIFHCFMFISSS